MQPRGKVQSRSYEYLYRSILHDPTMLPKKICISKKCEMYMIYFSVSDGTTKVACYPPNDVEVIFSSDKILDPVDIALDDDGLVYVLKKNGGIVVFEPRGAYLRFIGKYLQNAIAFSYSGKGFDILCGKEGKFNVQFSNLRGMTGSSIDYYSETEYGTRIAFKDPVAISSTDYTLYVLEHDQVLVLRRRGNLLQTKDAVLKSKIPVQNFSQPSAIVVDISESIDDDKRAVAISGYDTKLERYQIRIYQQAVDIWSGKWWPHSTYGVETKGALGNFDRPEGLTIDSLGRIFVADYGNARVQYLSTPEIETPPVVEPPKVEPPKPVEKELISVKYTVVSIDKMFNDSLDDYKKSVDDYLHAKANDLPWLSGFVYGIKRSQSICKFFISAFSGEQKKRYMKITASWGNADSPLPSFANADLTVMSVIIKDSERTVEIRVDIVHWKFDGMEDYMKHYEPKRDRVFKVKSIKKFFDQTIDRYENAIDKYNAYEKEHTESIINPFSIDTGKYLEVCANLGPGFSKNQRQRFEKLNQDFRGRLPEYYTEKLDLKITIKDPRRMVAFETKQKMWDYEGMDSYIEEFASA